MRLLAAAATLLTLILFVAALEPESAALDLALGLLTSASALAFLVGLAPPPTLRLLWRRPEQARAQSATAALLEYGTEREIAERILPTLRDLVGAEAAGVFVSGALLAAEGDVEALDRPEVVRVEIPEGEIRVAASPYAPVFGDEELRLLRSLAVLTGVALDRARLVARERELLERADELKTQFVALAAHELRTPIAALTGFAETLEQRGDELPPEQRELIERTLYEEIRRTGRLVEQLLDLSRLDAAAVKLDPQPLEVRAKVEELVRAAAGPRADDVAVEIPPGLVASLDADALERVVGNLVTNALRYGAPPITVTATQNGGHLRLAVEDSGEGVPEEFVPRLFERFTRSADAPSASGGSGLGLAIARSYAQAHGGELVYERGARGARFELVVPVA
jgi:signal transduction histidine kinase